MMNKKKPCIHPSYRVVQNIMQGVSQNPIILEHVFDLLATHVAANISAMINQLDRSVHGYVGAGGFSAVNDMNAARKI